MKNFSYLLKVSGCLLFMSGVLCFNSCKEDDATEEVATVSAISGTISGYSKYASMIDSVYVQDWNGVTMAKFPVSATGEFKFTLPTPAASNLVPVTKYISSSNTISNANAQLCVITFACYKQGVRTNYNLEYGVTTAATATGQTFSSIQYLYADGALTASGKTSVSQGDSFKYTLNTSVSLSLPKGWSQINAAVTATASTNSLTQDTSLSNTLPSNPTWTIQ